MSWLAFIASVVRSLAWPLAVVVLVVVLRKQLAALFAGLAARLANLRKLSAMGVDLEFETRIEEVSAEVEQLVPAVERPSSPGELSDAALLGQLAEIDPRASVVLAFSRVEAAARDAARRVLGDQSRVAPPQVLIRTLQQDNHISPVTREVFDELKMLRNRATHETEFVISRSAAIQYMEVAIRLMQDLDSIGAPEAS